MPLESNSRTNRLEVPDLGPISLLWPREAPTAQQNAPAWEDDLGLADLINAMTRDSRHAGFIRQVLTTLTTDPAVITGRQAVMADFVANPSLTRFVRAFTARLGNLRHGSAQLGSRSRTLLLETADRLAELDLYTEMVQELHDALAAAILHSTAMIALRDKLASLRESEGFKTLCVELPNLRGPLSKVASLTVGINIDTQLNPTSAVLMAVNERPIGTSASLIERVLGLRDHEVDESGIAPLHRVPSNESERPLSPLFQDLDHLLVQVTRPVAKALGRYIQINITSLLDLENELAFYASAADLVQKLQQKGVIFCQPEIAPPNERAIHLVDLVEIGLALRQPSSPIPNNLDLGLQGRIVLLTGPNSGGKTTFLRAMALAQIMAQAGLFVPAREAKISPVDGIFTHFPKLETRREGRFAEEAYRLREIFEHVTMHSLVLLNETLSSTSFGEALYLAQDIVAGLRAIGVRAIYATHLVELVERIPEIEAMGPGDSPVISLVAGVELDADGQARPTFRIAPGNPLGRSFALEIARRHGISFSQILEARQPRQ